MGWDSEDESLRHNGAYELKEKIGKVVFVLRMRNKKKKRA